jgi:SAM-dependent methyltransferase
MNTIKTIIRKLWQESPADLFTVGRRRIGRCLGNGDHGWDYSLESVIKNPKHMNTKMEIERWERHWRVCRLHGLGNVEKKFDFFGKSVFEVGCGPVFGCGPVALFKGAEKFWYQEPHFRRAVVESTAIKNKYFRPLHQELVANYGGQISFDEWYARVIELSYPLQAGTANVADLTISHSVLEHIPRRTLSSVLIALYQASRPGGCFSHTVDLGPHGHGDSTLAGLYRMNRDAEPRHLNLLRKCDVESAIIDAGLDLTASVIYKADEIDPICVHKSWRRYSREDLATRVVFFLGRRPCLARECIGTRIRSDQYSGASRQNALV